MSGAYERKGQSMSVRYEIEVIEERLRQAELRPAPSFFEEALADDAVFVSNGDPAFDKRQVVEAHRPGNGPKFTAVRDDGHEHRRAGPGRGRGDWQRYVRRAWQHLHPQVHAPVAQGERPLANGGGIDQQPNGAKLAKGSWTTSSTTLWPTINGRNSCSTSHWYRQVWRVPPFGDVSGRVSVASLELDPIAALRQCDRPSDPIPEAARRRRTGRRPGPA
jgi:hypothetical protein